MADRQPFVLEFQASDSLIPAGDLGLFLHLFSNIHDVLASSDDVHALAALDLSGNQDIETKQQIILHEGFTQSIRSRLVAPAGSFPFRPEGVQEDSRLQIRAIQKASPLIIISTGIALALTAAVILSGGEIEMPWFKARLPPLGTGIKSLLDAFHSLRG